MNLLTKTIPFIKDAAWLLDVFKNEPYLFFLDSGLRTGEEGQYSYLGFSPFKTIQAKDFNSLRIQLKPYLGIKSSLPFRAGAVGRMSYDGDLWFGLYAGIICVDHRKKKLTITASGLTHKTAASQQQVARRQIDYVLNKIRNSLSSPKELIGDPGDWTSRLLVKEGVSNKLVIKNNTTQAKYVAAVKKALAHIKAGDIYQINLSHRFEARFPQGQRRVAPTEIYQHLRALSPSDFSAYLDDGKQVILSSSPERFLRLAKGVVQVKPMKGTRPRGVSVLQDKKNKQELINSSKEKAELLMVTDLERNDLGRVCEYGSVRVKAMRTIEEYATVFQATSTVEGKLRKDCDQFDLLESTFPSGSVTGCPKIEAMKIIKKLEKTNRGLYTGALGYISFSGDMDFNVLIRTLFVEKDKISFHVGGGIVADSNPRKEYEETLLKAKAMTESLRRIS